MRRNSALFEWILLSLLAALMFVLKLAMAPLPNIEPVSLLIIVYTLVFGRKALYAVYLYVGLEILVFGFGLWNFAYFYIWAVLFLLTRLLRNMNSRVGFAVLSGAFGLCFGLLCMPVFMISGGVSYGLSSYVSGIPYDLLHCVGNFVIALVLQDPLTKLLRMLRRRYLPEEQTTDTKDFSETGNGAD